MPPPLKESSFKKKYKLINQMHKKNYMNLTILLMNLAYNNGITRVKKQ